MFEVLTTTRARSSKSFTLCFYMITIRAKQAKVHFTYFVQRDQHGIIAKHNANFNFNAAFSLQLPSELLKLPNNDGEGNEDVKPKYKFALFVTK